MTQRPTWAERQARLLDRLHARLASRGPPARGFVAVPEPRSIGRAAVGRQLIEGRGLPGGREVPGAETPWDGPAAAAPTAAMAAEADALHGFAWLDDLAALGDGRAQAVARRWLWGWIARFGRGRGPGWSPGTTGRRVLRWIAHAEFLLRDQDGDAVAAFHASLARQLRFLGQRAGTAPAGLSRFEAAAGLVCGALAVEGLGLGPEVALDLLVRDCGSEVDGEGGIATRNPEELLEILLLLGWVSDALRDRGTAPPPPILAAAGRIAPVLRTLRHADGRLARFHGGSGGVEGRLEGALALIASRARGAPQRGMGYVRLSGGRTTLIVDAAPPPRGEAGRRAHASTLAFELTSGRRPVVINCGPGESFGPDWARAGRATPSHSTVVLDGLSSARLGPGDSLADGPGRVPVELGQGGRGARLSAGQDGWRLSHGLTHARTLELSPDGRSLLGEDLLCTLDERDRLAFDRARDGRRASGLTLAIRFHLHPDVAASLDADGRGATLRLKSGERWSLRHDGRARLSLEPSVELEPGQPGPRPTQQVVLSARATSYATKLRWSLAKTLDTPEGLRDLADAEEDGD